MKKEIITAVTATAFISSFITYSVCGGITTNANSAYSADVNGDGKVDVMDLNVVKNILLDLGSSNESDNPADPTVEPSVEPSDEPSVEPSVEPSDEPAEIIDEPGQLTILCWNTNDSQPMVDLFCEKTGTDPSKINIKCFNVQGGAAAEQYTQYLSDADNDADIMFLESDWCLDFINDDNMTLPLTELGYKDSDFSDIYNYVVETGRSTTTGALKGISWQAAAGTYCYRSDLAEKYLGVKSPDEMQARVDNWDKFMQTAEELKLAGGPAISATLYGVLGAYAFSNNDPWLDNDNKLVINDYCKGYIEYANQLWNNGYVTKASQWSESWLPLGQTNDVMGFFVPSWGFGDTILTSAAGGEGGRTFGKWKCIAGPSEYYWGGTWLAPTARINNQKLAKQFIDFFTINEDGAEAYAEKQNEYMSNKKVMEKIIAKGEYKGAPVLGGQNQFEVLNKVADAIDVKGKITPYDSTIKNDLRDTAAYYCGKSSFTVNKVIEAFMNTVYEDLGDKINKNTDYNPGPDWRTIYWSEIKKYSSQTGAMYELYDVTGDDIPELFISTGQAYASTVKIYTIANDKIAYIGDYGTEGRLGINTDKNVLLSFAIHSGVEIYKYFTISGTKVTVLVDKYYDSSDNSYYVNNKKVTKEEYTNSSKEYRVTRSDLGRKYKTTVNPNTL